MLGVLAAVLCWAGLAPVQAQQWWNNEWSGRLQVIVDTTAEGAPLGATANEVTALLRLHGGNFPFGVTQPDGSDIRMVADDHATVLPHYVERFDDLLQEGFIWVRIPEVAANAETRIWMYYGNSGPMERQSGAAAFGTNALLVYPFSARGMTPMDASGNNLHAENAGIRVEGSLAAGGLRLNGRMAVTVPAAPVLDLPSGGTFTLSVWASPETHAADAVLVQRRGASDYWQLGLNAGTAFVEFSRGGAVQRIDGGDIIPVNTWRHIALRTGNGTVDLLVDGVVVGSVAGDIAGIDGTLQIGRTADAGEGFAGQLDQLVLTRDQVTDAALRFAALNQGTGSRSARMVRISDGEAATHSALSQVGGYFAIIMNSITTEGWFILILLAGMSIFSWVIMGTKLMQLNDNVRANKQFVRLWQHVAYDLALLDNDEAIETLGGDINSEQIRTMRRSPIFKLYQTGVNEIRHRIRGTASGTFKLSGAAMQAIRSSMDRTFTTEYQTLNARIVYLTISISGGPFLGLLGTVVGVTITFAAIAAAGDVNINSIAPGVAAALTTTIVGLLVAIPALFAYNYFVIRIRNIVAEMRVFMDEFVSKTSEFYSKKGNMGERFDEEAREEMMAARQAALAKEKQEPQTVGTQH